MLVAESHAHSEFHQKYTSTLAYLAENMRFKAKEKNKFLNNWTRSRPGNPYAGRRNSTALCVGKWSGN